MPGCGGYPTGGHTISTCLAFLYTLVDKDLSISCITNMSRNDIEPLGLVFSTINWMAGSIQFMWCRDSPLCYFFVS